jgi:hypothetical protein
MTTTAPGRSRRRLLGLSLALLALAVVAILVVPMWLVQPFAPQTPRGLAVAFWLRRLAPVATAVLALCGIALAARLWRGARWWSRLAMALGLLLLGAGAVLSHVDAYEVMFHPMTATAFAPAAEASWVAAADPVLAVTVGGEAAAYPVRQVAYHHVVHDEVGGVPIVVTY